MSQELYHHGILGMKWGIRRFQNKDGRLTKEGREHLKEQRVNGDSNIQIHKGDSLYRATNADETLDDRRKYVSSDKSEGVKYQNLFSDMMYQDYKLDEYIASKDLKIAQAREVLDSVIDKMGDAKVDDFLMLNHQLKVLKDNKKLYTKDMYKRLKAQYSEKAERLANKNAGDYLVERTLDNAHRGSISDSDVSQILNKALYRSGSKVSEEILTEYKQKGYDAIVDVEDYFGGGWDTPLIMLNPQDSMYRKK